MLFGLVLLVLWGCSGEGRRPIGQPKGEHHVQISGSRGNYTLLRHGEPFVIKGGAGKGFYRQLAEAGGNTLRVYDTVGLGGVLDSAQRYGLMVIADLPLPGSLHNRALYRSSRARRQLYTATSATVLQHREHPALLMWNLGNELEFPPSLRYLSFFRAYRHLLAEVKRLDPHHPVSTSLAGPERRKILMARLVAPRLDLLGINAFGHVQGLEAHLKRFDWLWKGPYFISEWGPNGYWESAWTPWSIAIEPSSWAKAVQLTERYEQHMPHSDPRFLGSCVFFWGSKEEATATWFNIFDHRGNKTPLYEAIRWAWTGTQGEFNSPGLDYMLVDGRGAEDALILLPGTPHQATLNFYASPQPGQQVIWELRPEDWYREGWDEAPELPALHTLLWVSSHGDTARFLAPGSEGPYRLFAWVENPEGYSAAANTPFYILP